MHTDGGTDTRRASHLAAPFAKHSRRLHTRFGTDVTIVRSRVTHDAEPCDTRPSRLEQANLRALFDAQSVLLIICGRRRRNEHPPQDEGLRSPSRQPDRPAARISKETIAMRDLTADWQKWSSAERFLAVVLVLVLIGLPLRFLITTAPL